MGWGNRVLVQMRHLLTFRRRPRLRWGTTLHSSFVPVEFLLPPERTVTYCAHEWFGPTTARVSDQVSLSSECTPTCCTFMHCGYTLIGILLLVLFILTSRVACREEGSDWLNIDDRWRHRRMYLREMYLGEMALQS